MSSSSPRRRRPGAAAAVALGWLFLLALVAVGTVPSAKAADARGTPEVKVQSTGSADDPRVRVIADSGVRDPAEVSDRDLALSVSGSPLASRAVPLLSSSTDLVVVLDTSAAGLAGFRSGVTDLLLGLPEGARTGVVAAGALPRVLSPLSPGATGALAQLSVLDTSGQGQPSASGSAAAQTSARRSSVSDALGLALSALGPAAPDARPRVVVLNTSAPDAGGEAAAAMGDRLRAASVVLDVVGGSAASEFWGPVAESTGGRLVVSEADRTSDAVTQVSDGLRHTFLVSFTRPGTAEAQVALRVNGAGRGAGATIALDAVGASGRPVARTTSATDDAGSGGTVALIAVVAALLAAAGALVFQWDRRRPHGKHEPGAPVQDLMTLLTGGPQPATSVVAPQAAESTSVPGPTPVAAPPPAEWGASQPEPHPQPTPEVRVEAAPVDAAPDERAPQSPPPAPTQPELQPEQRPAPTPGRHELVEVATTPASTTDEGPRTDEPSASVIDAERRARAAGAAVAAAARAARVSRTVGSPPTRRAQHAGARHRAGAAPHEDEKPDAVPGRGSGADPAKP